MEARPYMLIDFLDLDCLPARSRIFFRDVLLFCSRKAKHLVVQITGYRSVDT